MRFISLFLLFWALVSFAPDVYYCPMHCEGAKVYESAGSCPVCHMYLVKKGEEGDENAPLSLRDYRVDLTTEPGEVKAGVEARINLTPRQTKNNAVLRDLEEVHGTEMEVYVTTQELDRMIRTRPLLLSEGTFCLKHTFESAGNYLLYVLIHPKGKRAQIFPLALKVGGEKKKGAPQPKLDRVSMKLPPKVTSGEKVTATFTVQREENGKKKHPVVREFAYIVWVSRDTTRFIPIHTAVKEISKGKWQLESELKFPKPGQYIAFVEPWNTPEMVSFEASVK